MVDKEAVKKNFSRFARFYDKYSHIQDLCGLRLITKIEANNFSRILDIGCGTGNYTRLLREKFPKAYIKAIDISGAMVEVAEEKLKGDRIEFAITDGETMHFDESFDFISSNAAFQWFEDLDGVLARYRGYLDENGIISFSIFGPLTFYELNKSLKELLAKDVSINSCNFMEMTGIKLCLENLFKESEVEQKIYKEKYNSLLELLNTIRYTGARGIGINGRGFWIPKRISDLEMIYKNIFKDIVATYQVFFCKGVK